MHGESKEVAKEVIASDPVDDGSQGLSLRDALDIAIKSEKEIEKGGDSKAEPAPSNKGTKAPNKEASRSEDRKAPDMGGAEKASGDGKGESPKPTFNAPGEWSKDEIEDFKVLSPKQQEAVLRLHKSRSTTLSEIRQEAAELQWAKDIVKEITPFLKTRGDKEPTHAQVIKALKVVNEVDSNTKGAVAAILKAKGIAVPKELLEEGTKDSVSDEKIIPLQKELDEIKSWKAQQEHAEVSSILTDAWSTFEQSKNAAGTLKFPDANNTQSGIKLASNIGSLVGQQSELSKQFVAMVKARIPDANYQTLLTEAYRYCGGKVDDSSEPPRTQTTQKHIVRSSRAASSVPGRAAQSSSNGQVKRFKTYREAAAAALEEHREREGV